MTDRTTPPRTRNSVAHLWVETEDGAVRADRIEVVRHAPTISPILRWLFRWPERGQVIVETPDSRHVVASCITKDLATRVQVKLRAALVEHRFAAGTLTYTHGLAWRITPFPEPGHPR